jgi:multidrug efflux pump subunit AcrA (membrane-fusion protein)
MRSFISRKPWILITIGAVVLAVIMIATRERTAPLQRPERAWTVNVIPAKTETLRPTLALFGSVQSPQNAQLSSGIDGLITEVAALDGESVEDGQVLVLVDDRDARLNLQQAQADLLEVEAQQAFAERRLKRSRQAFEKERELLELIETRSARAQDLFEQGLLSQSDLDTTQENLTRQQLAGNQAQLLVEEVEIRLTELSAQRSRAQALRDQAGIDLERTRLLAPFDGVISDLAVSEGDRVRGDDQLMRLQNPASIEVRTQIPARYAEAVTAGLAAGQAMSAIVEIGEQNIRGELARISGQTREASGGVDSFIRFRAPPRTLRLGSTVRVYLELPPQENVIAVPAEALYGRDQLYTLVDKRMQMVEVERVGERVQASGTTEVLIRAPQLSVSDRIVVTKLSNAANGLLTETADAAPGPRVDPASRAGN